MSATFEKTSEHRSVRKPAVAGRFYHADPTELQNDINSYLRAGKPAKSFPRFLISPHAGYMFSGAVAGIGYATINPAVKTVILIGPSHHKWFEGVSIPDFDSYETPLGHVQLEKNLIEKLRGHSFVQSLTSAHLEEHCLEVQIPFLQTVLTSFKIIPILCGRVNPVAVAEMIDSILDDNTLVVVSSDLSHYNSDEQARKIDAQSLKTILTGKHDGVLDACGETPIRIVMKLAQMHGLNAKVLDARNSFQVAPHYGSSERVVGYASVIFEKPESPESTSDSSSVQFSLSAEDRNYLLTLARKALNSAVTEGNTIEAEYVPEFSRQYCGCFVTLTIDGRLRGCIGYIEGIKPLYQAVVDNARNSALGDPRFPNVVPDELDRITVELSILSRPSALEYSDEHDLLAQIISGEDGLILQKGYRQSTFLPQVWDNLPDKVQFLEHLAMKAGLSKDDWKTASYRRYKAIHFKEEK